MTTTKAPDGFGIFRREFIALLIERFSINFLVKSTLPFYCTLVQGGPLRVPPEQFRFDGFPSINPHQRSPSSCWNKPLGRRFGGLARKSEIIHPHLKTNVCRPFYG